MTQPTQQPLEGDVDGAGNGRDVEKGLAGGRERQEPDSAVPGVDQPAPPSTSRANHLLDRLPPGMRKATATIFERVELRGIAPIPAKERKSRRPADVFTLWWSANVNISGIAFGMLGVDAYGLRLRDASLVILFFTLLSATLPAWFTTLGPKTGMRQMVQARYSWGRYIVSFPVLLNLATLVGFCVILSVIGGQCLAAAGSGTISANVGIVIMALLALLISFCGYGVLHEYERFAWIPAVIAIIVATGCGGSGLLKQPAPEDLPPTTVQSVFSFGMIVASYMIPWAALASDFSTYLEPSTSSLKIFSYSYAGLSIPPILFMTLGAAIAGARPNNPEWQAGYEANLVGGILDAMLARAGGFGKFLVVILSFSLLGNVAATSYSITLNLQLLLPWRLLLLRVPRCVFSLLLTAVVIPVSIAAAADFFLSLENFVALIGYWSSAFLAVLLVEHFWFRKGDCDTYDGAIWEDASSLPPGIAALVSFLLSFALIIPSMAQVWWVGPIAETTGDIGFELAFVVSTLLYLPLRTIEKRVAGR